MPFSAKVTLGLEVFVLNQAAVVLGTVNRIGRSTVLEITKLAALRLRIAKLPIELNRAFITDLFHSLLSINRGERHILLLVT